MKKNLNKGYIIGIDEVGRGPIAGPVAVCTFIIKDQGSLESSIKVALENKDISKLKDSKKLSEKQREAWFSFLKKEKEKGICNYVVSFVSNQSIDKFGIAKCIQKALDDSLMKITKSEVYNFGQTFINEKLFMRSSDERGGSGTRVFQKELQDFVFNTRIYLDGGLHAPKEYTNQETIIKGDELYPVISMASIMAKVMRDRVMIRYNKKYPEYGFENHKGYGTKAHYEAIKNLGKTKIHRKTFIH